ncbi:hypothetical protein H696_05231 [Fonticula alba]|uniref:Uncharacterized protein n=1 Tax=Fonticula alba TaxID=691883 RepID=A0A058Z300_FONAL|nr:hypothetical protein H696_05231 [Fonticula alba]KCV68313.1 hypothetical protein H696_05231 [Fonticula alba]|eukprot:XP_009497367.1 hypothetical protein H696_05231 [Fonticula alba]
MQPSPHATAAAEAAPAMAATMAATSPHPPPAAHQPGEVALSPNMFGPFFHRYWISLIGRPVTVYLTVAHDGFTDSVRGVLSPSDMSLPSLAEPESSTIRLELAIDEAQATLRPSVVIPLSKVAAISSTGVDLAPESRLTRDIYPSVAGLTPALLSNFSSLSFDTFLVDSEIGSGGTAATEQVMVPWELDASDPVISSDMMEALHSQPTEKFDQFEVNRTRFGKVVTFDESKTHRLTPC